MFAEDKHFSLVETFVNYGCKFFNNIGAWKLGLYETGVRVDACIRNFVMTTLVWAQKARV